MAAQEESQQFCSQCQRYVLARRPGTNHVFHLLMCVFTCGLWVFIWFLAFATKAGGWRCSNCGGMTVAAPSGQGQGMAPTKPAIPRALMLLGAGIGALFGLAFLIGMCSVMKSRSDDKAATIAESKARMADNAVAVERGPWQQPPDVAVIGEILAGRVKPLGVDKTGDTLEIERYNVPGWSVAQIARKKHSPRAWSIHVSGGSECSVAHWAPTAVLRGDDGGLPMQAKWYRLTGGPLDGLIVKAFINTKDECAWHFATQDYAALQDWKHTR